MNLNSDAMSSAQTDLERLRRRRLDLSAASRDLIGLKRQDGEKQKEVGRKRNSPQDDPTPTS